MEHRARCLYVCLVVRDLVRATRFFAALGFSFQPEWTDDSAACLVVNEGACVMLLARPCWSPYVPQVSTGAFPGVIAFSCGSREEVERIRSMAISGGGAVDDEALDLAHLYSARFRDLDGYPWEAVWTAPQTRSLHYPIGVERNA